MKKVWSFFKGIIIAVWVLAAIMATICLISYNEFSVSEIGKNSIFVIDNSRWEPAFKEDDLVIVKKVDEGQYNVGDYAFFYIDNPADAVFINYGQITKIVEENHAEDSYYFGDDVVSFSKMIGPVNGCVKYHKWGLVLSIFESKWGFMFLVIFPTLFAIVYEIYSIIEEAKELKEDGKE